MKEQPARGAGWGNGAGRPGGTEAAQESHRHAGEGSPAGLCCPLGSALGKEQNNKFHSAKDGGLLGG